ncbi:MAG: protease complex subunit PrcB family protein [Coprococcus sp.]
MTVKVLRISIFMLLIVSLCACSKGTTREKKVSDLDFTVVNQEDISEELMKHIEERKAESFTLIYKDGENMFLTIGYGQQASGGYSIKVNDLYLGETSVCVSTSLEGPEADEKKDQIISYPYIVLKMETMDCPVIFDM